jgi:hypothetical protein
MSEELSLIEQVSYANTLRFIILSFRKEDRKLALYASFESRFRLPSL